MKHLARSLWISAIFLCFSCSPNEQGHHFSVSTASPEATRTGIEILQRGGNAIDAAVAISFVLGVTEPAMSGLGGGSQVIFSPAAGEPVSINGTTFAPEGTPPQVSRDSVYYHRRSTIPSTVKVMDFIWRNYGSGKLVWSDLLHPAIQYAADGFEVGSFRHKVFRKYQAELKDSPHHTDAILLANGDLPAPGDTLKQPILAGTLRRLAAGGASEFYNGEISRRIVEDMTANGGWITAVDLENFPNPSVSSPLRTTYRGYDVYSQPPPCGGWTTLLALNLLERNTADAISEIGPVRNTALALALNTAHNHRRDDPIDDMLNYHTEINLKIEKSYADSLSVDGGETTHFSVVDPDGNLVAVTASINAYFGAKAASPTLGFLYNTYMDDFTYGDPGHPYAARAGAMAYSSMSPTIVKKEGVNLLAIGSPGSARIISAVAQCVQLWIDSDLSIREIVALPRVHSVGRRVYLEDPDPITIAGLRKIGFEIAFPAYDLISGKLNPYFGGVHAVAFEHGIWMSAADPRRDGLAITAGVE